MEDRRKDFIRRVQLTAGHDVRWSGCWRSLWSGRESNGSARTKAWMRAAKKADRRRWRREAEAD